MWCNYSNSNTQLSNIMPNTSIYIFQSTFVGEDCEISFHQSMEIFLTILATHNNNNWVRGWWCHAVWQISAKITPFLLPQTTDQSYHCTQICEDDIIHKCFKGFPLKILVEISTLHNHCLYFVMLAGPNDPIKEMFVRLYRIQPIYCSVYTDSET